MARTRERPLAAGKVSPKEALLLAAGLSLLAFFGISLPIVRVGGGLIVAATAWRLLTVEPGAVAESRAALAEVRRETADGEVPPREERPRDDELDLYGLTHAGRVRGENQDHFLLCTVHPQVVVHGTSLPDVASLTAPRPLLVQQCRRDALFPLAGVWLLRRLAVEAPGTWAHSVAMANLCESACAATVRTISSSASAPRPPLRPSPNAGLPALGLARALWRS